jgi:hypothetical protein
MKTNHRSSHQQPGRIVQKFGKARLFRRPGGKHELVGGTADDIATANDWTSLVAHEVVFSHPFRNQPRVGAAKNKPVVIRLYSGRPGCA